MSETAPSQKGETPPAIPKHEIGDRVQGFEIIGIRDDGTYEFASSSFTYGSVEDITNAKNARLSEMREAGDTPPAPDEETEAEAIERTIDDDIGGNKGRGTMKRVKPTSTSSKLQEHKASKDTRKLTERAGWGFWRDRSINGYGEAPSIARSAGVAGKYAKHPELAQGKVKEKLEEAVNTDNPQVLIDHIHDKPSGRMTAEEYLEKAKEERDNPGHFEREKDEYPIRVRGAKKLARQERRDNQKVYRLKKRSEKRAQGKAVFQRVLPVASNVRRKIQRRNP